LASNPNFDRFARRAVMNTRRKILTAVLPVALLAGPLGVGRAATAPDALPEMRTLPTPPQVKVPAGLAFAITVASHVSIEADGTATEISTTRTKILTPGAIAAQSQQKEQYVEGMETLEVVEAFTEKPDGTKVPVDPSSIISSAAGADQTAIYTHDQKQLVAIFPDVAVGDTVVMTTHKHSLSSFLPGQVNFAAVFPHNLPLVSAQIVIDAPATLDLQVKTYGSAMSDLVEDIGELRRHTVTLGARNFWDIEPQAVAPIDIDPAVVVSTIKSYADLGRMFADAALPKATVTPEIAALAETITKGIDDRRKQAIAIDTWMKTNIRYVGVYLQAGRIIPHDAASVLRNKFGDCKDKATLMSALLAAKGIESELVLINAGNAYTLREPANIAAFNHAIMYLPEFDLYDDPTAQLAAFGVLSPETYDKPVLRVSAAGAALARTPAMKPQDHVAFARTTIEVAADGTMKGRTVERDTGVFAIGMRTQRAAIQSLSVEVAAQQVLNFHKTPGTGRFQFRNSGAADDPVVAESSFTLNDKFKAPEQDGKAAIPNGTSITVRPGNFLLGTLPGNRKSDFACYAGRMIEEIDATFDPALPMPVAPSPVKINNAAFSYTATFKIEGRTLKVHREFISHVAHQTCQPKLEAAIARDMNTVRGNLEVTYVFHRSEPAETEVAAAAPATPPVPPAQPAQPAQPAPPSHPAPTTTGQGPAKPVETIKVAAPAPAEQKPREVNVAADQQLRLSFFYSLNPDCTSMGYTAVRVVEQPKHGKIKVEQGTGFASFPNSNVRSECNKRRSEGVIVTYEPEPGYTGTDSVDLDAIFPEGSLAKRRYAINVR
jgi:uncharacterized protein DUF3857/transglutaminase superfamily protein